MCICSTYCQKFGLEKSGIFFCFESGNQENKCSGFWCHRLEQPAYPHRICAVTRSFQTMTLDLSVFQFLPRHYHSDWFVTITIRQYCLVVLMSTNVVSSCNLQNAYYYQLSVAWLRPLCRRSLFCTSAVQVYSPVSFVFALHMIKTWNYKNWNRTGTAVFN